MDNVWTDDDHYPSEACGAELARLIRHFAEQTNTPVKLTGPIVLSTICASTQAHVDVRTPYGIDIPTSEYFMIVAGAALKKTTARQRIMKGFLEEDELEDSASIERPIVLENASEGGILDTFVNGARSILFAHDDASKFLNRMDIPGSCKRFDGNPIRHTTREDHHVLLTGRRTSMCLLTQDRGLDKIMISKGEDLLNLGFLSRTLPSFASEQAKKDQSYTPRAIFNVSTEEERFHERVRNLRIAYRHSPDEQNSKRLLLTLSKEADDAWYGFVQYLDWSGRDWEDVQSFTGRAGEHVVRISAALQWFVKPQGIIEAWAVHSAITIVKWHLREVKRWFGSPPQEIVMKQYAHELNEFLRKRAEMNKTVWSKAELQRYAPKKFRDPHNLDMALAPLLYLGYIYYDKNSDLVVPFYGLNPYRT